jgi:hypothetical protein
MNSLVGLKVPGPTIRVFRMSDQSHDFKPCPFCGGTRVDLRETRLSPRIDGKTPALISATVRHWCPRANGVVSCGLTFTARTVEDAVNAWNQRV